MKSRQLIIGSGVAAGLAANLLEDKQEWELIWANDVVSSPIPELLPRRVFFDSLGVEPEEEKIAVAEVASDLQEVVWIDGGERLTRRLTSTKEYLIYDKNRLAGWLRRRAIAKGVSPLMLDISAQKMDFGNYQRVLDCRGFYAVLEDPNYKIVRETQARTSCTYALFNRPYTVASKQMMFWSVKNSDGMLQTFFCVPIGGSGLSIGCSHTTTIKMDVNRVLAVVCDFGVPVNVEHLRFSGQAVPHIDTAMTLMANVKPIGEAVRRSCPLTEYGVMFALSQLLQLTGKQGLSSNALLRPPHNQIDPHIPLELFL